MVLSGFRNILFNITIYLCTVIEFGFEQGHVGINKRFIANKINLKSIFLRFDCECDKDDDNGNCVVLLSMSVFEHQFDTIFKFVKKRSRQWNDIQYIFECLIIDPLDKHFTQKKTELMKIVTPNVG